MAFNRLKSFFMGFSPIERIVGSVMITTLPLWWFSNYKASKQLDVEKATKDQMQQQVTFDRFVEKYNAKQTASSSSSSKKEKEDQHSQINSISHNVSQSSTNSNFNSPRSS